MGLYPGLGLPLKHSHGPGHASFPIGLDESIGSLSELLPVREVAMMMVMEQLTDKLDWYQKVFDDTIVAKWRDEALATPDIVLYSLTAKDRRPDVGGVPMPINIMSEVAFSWCIEELRSKARYFEKTGLIPTLDTAATVVKSDVLVGDTLREALRKAFQTLQASQSDAPDWHPGSNDMVQDLVHPSMYPLVYGRTRVLKDEVVGIADAIEKWAGKGDIIEKEVPKQAFRGYSDITPAYWSDTYQWLPANVAFQEDGSVKFTSYINNLHPNKYPEIYRTIEKLIETVLPAWDQCLTTLVDHVKTGPGRKISRFIKFNNPDDENPDLWSPSNPAELDSVEVDLTSDWRYEDYISDNEGEPDVLSLRQIKWEVLREPSLSCFDEMEREDVDYKVDGGLRKTFEKSGLQIIVKLASIELTPENPDFPIGGWHIEGQMNEHICATALYYIDSDNVTESSLSFRMPTSEDQYDNFEIGQDAYHWMESAYGTSLGGGSGGSCLQNYGTVNTPQGRVLAFPNVFQHRVSPFKLIDPTKPGHRRFIALWLVDPHLRIISTANVPPQQQDWWAESAFGSSSESQESAANKLPSEMVQLLHEKGVLFKGADAAGETAKLPAELLDMVRKQFDGATPMSVSEAKEHRAGLMQVRTAYHGEAERNWEQLSYSFCEH